MFSYQVRESTVIVTGRPRKLTAGGEDFTGEADADIDAYLSVTDTFVVPPKDKIFCWFPWNEGRKPIPEMYYATNHVLNWWTHYQKLKRVQVFCDAGTHRSVTVFGAFLVTYFDKHEREKIVRERVALKKYEYTDEQLAGYAHPLEYIETYLEDFPADRLLFRAMKRDYLGRLDGHSKEIYDIVKERYGDNKI